MAEASEVACVVNVAVIVPPLSIWLTRTEYQIEMSAPA
jgi:hypothetical protein